MLTTLGELIRHSLQNEKPFRNTVLSHRAILRQGQRQILSGATCHVRLL